MLFLIILILTIICSYILPWWFVAAIAFIAAFFINTKPEWAFLSGLGGVFIAWAIVALLKTIPNDNILAGRVSNLFPVHSWLFILIVTSIVGGLVGGMAALSGALVRKAFRDK